MKNKSKTTVALTEDEIRDYAFHLYQQSGCVPGHDEENWFEAKACLEASIPKHHARGRLHRHRHQEAERGVIARESSDPQSAEADQDEDVTIEGIVLVSTP